MPDILITNDDGIHAPGLAALKIALNGLGKIHIVAPDSERSAAGHAITMLHTLRVSEVFQGNVFFGIATNGTPADCVKLAIQNLLPCRPDLVVSGINLGPNTGTNVLYSGTVSAALEATIAGIPSLAVSMGALRSEHDYNVAGDFALQIAQRILKQGLPPGIMLNLNVPIGPKEAVKGIRVARQASYLYHDRYERRQDPRGRDYYWLTLEDVEILDPSPDADAIALQAGYATLTPLHCNLTAQPFLPTLQQWLDTDQ